MKSLLIGAFLAFLLANLLFKINTEKQIVNASERQLIFS